MRPDWLIRIESRGGRGRRRLDNSGWRRLRLRLRARIDLDSERPFSQRHTRSRINQAAVVRVVAMHFGEFADDEIAAMDSVAVDEGARPMVLGGVFEQRQLRLRIGECGVERELERQRLEIGADPLQPRTILDDLMLGVIILARRLERLRRSQHVEDYFSQYRVHLFQSIFMNAAATRAPRLATRPLSFLFLVAHSVRWRACRRLLSLAPLRFA